MLTIKDKENILSILSNLKEKWDLAEELYIVVEKSQNMEIVDILIKIFSESMEKVKNEKIRQKLKKGQKILKAMLQGEEEERSIELEKAEKLINII